MFGIDDAVATGLKIIDKFIPDPETKAKATSELLQAHLTELQELTKADIAQAGVNAVEAQSEGIFKSGWRPAVGWVCVAGLGYSFVGKPLLGYALILGCLALGFDISLLPIMPSLDLNELMTLLFGMLGMGAYRSYDKKTPSAK